jgi:KDO2-lipid IV(A) lauroyltransferase
VATAITRVVPLKVAYALADLAGEIWYLLSPRLRDVLEHNLALVPGLGGAHAARRSLARRISRNFGRVVAEFLYSPRLGPDDIGGLVDIPSFEPLRKYAGGSHAVFATAHLGSWELAAAVLSMLGVRLTVIVYDDPDPRVARLFRERREARGVRVLPVKATSREVLAALRETSLGVVADRDFSGQGMAATFFGRPAKVPFAYAGLALALGVPVVFGICVKGEDGRYRLVLEEPIVGDREDPDAARKMAARCIEMIEKYVEKYPEQWYFFQKVGGD